MTQVDLSELVLSGTGIDRIAAFLDGLSPGQRLAQVQGSPRKMQPLLFDLAAHGAPLTLNDFVSPSTPAGQPVIHQGWNNLPLPAFGRRFKKPMVRHPDHPDQLFGYNDSPFTPLIGPGYFIHTSTDHQPDWADRGGTVIDYFRVPDHDVPSTWPRVRPNSRGLQFFVYHKTRDFMRRVSAHVTIGAAYKKGQRIGAFFMLVRQDG
ncbi:MAG: hypothetical protein GXP62_07995 [Oligoflexia bacterium]|nr:hypothetical protein [Oligoflexia bacterium]